MPFRRDDERNRFRAGFTPDEMRELRDASDRIMRAIESVKSEFKSELTELRAELKATASTMVPRTEFEVRHRAVEADIAELKQHADESFSKWISGAALFFSALAAIAVTVGLIAQHWH